MAHTGGRTEQRVDVSAVDVVEHSVAVQLEDDHGGVLAHVFGADVVVGDFGDALQRLTGEQLRIDHPLQCGGEYGGGDPLAGDVGEDQREALIVGDDVVEVSANLFARDGASCDL